MSSFEDTAAKRVNSMTPSGTSSSKFSTVEAARMDEPKEFGEEKPRMRLFFWSTQLDDVEGGVGTEAETPIVVS